MKKTLFYIASLLVGALGFTACDDEPSDMAQPPMDKLIPQLTVKANTTIMELKEAFNQSTQDFATLVGTREDGSDYIISGHITTSTESGNIFKKVYVQDATSGICVSINSSDLDDTYRIGREVAINVTGLYVGNYNNCLQIGGPASSYGSPDRISAADWTAHTTIDGTLQIGGLKNPNAVEPLVFTIPELKSIKSNPEELLKYSSMLIKLENVHFKSPGEVFADEGKNNVARTLVDDEGNTIDLNMSGYSNFWYMATPSGKGSVTAILSYYRSNYQLLVSGLDDFHGFDPIEKAKTPLYSETFGSSQGEFTVENVSMPSALTYVWQFKSNYGMVASAFANSTSYAADSWLISPTLDLSQASDLTLSFDQAMNKFSTIEAALGMCTVAARIDNGAWQTLTVPTWPSALAWTFIPSGAIDINALAGHNNVQIGFHYTSVDGDSGSWEIKNFTITGNGSVAVIPAK